MFDRRRNFFFLFAIALSLIFSITFREENCNCNSNPVASNLSFKFPVMQNLNPPYPSLASPKPSIKDTPSYFSWLDYEGKDWTTPARYQGNCGSCWAFAAVGGLEAIINIREGIAEIKPDLSEQYILSCLSKAGSCYGGDPYWAFHYIRSTEKDGNYRNGIITEDCMPYMASDTFPCQSKCIDWENYLVPISDYGYWIPDGSSQDRQRIKSQIMDKGPVVTYMMATDEFMEWGLKNHNSTDYFPYRPARSINHCVTIVGWKDDTNIPRGGYWICKNSWGSYWGYKGFFNIEYGSLLIDNFSIVWVEYDKNAYDWPPVADAGGPYVAKVGEEIVFDGSKSRDDSDEINSWNWNFGDGSTSKEKIARHTYSERGIYDIILRVMADEKEGIDKTSALIDVWKKGDSWTFNVKKIEVETSSLKFYGRIDDLKAEVIDDSEDYMVKIDGKIYGNFSYSSQPKLQISGRFLFNRINGKIYLEKDFSIEKIYFMLRGVALTKIGDFPFPMPLPFKGEIKIDFSSPYSIFDFPIEQKKWILNVTNLNIDAYASALFGIINYPIKYTISLGSMEIDCSGKETVQTEAGIFSAYKISIYDIVKIYYSPEIANLVKGNVNFEGINIEAELKEVNYK